jgi:hypothetical protein
MTTGYTSTVLDEYRRLVDSDLQLVEQSQASAVSGYRAGASDPRTDAAALSTVRDVLISLRRLLDEYTNT